MTARPAPAGEHERHYQELRLRVEQHRAEVAGRDDEDAELDPAVDRLVGATDELLAFEDRLPVLRDLPARALSVQVVRAAGLAALLGGVLLGLGVWRDVLGGGWIPVVPITLLAALRIATLTVEPAVGRHRRQRYVAAACGAAGMLIGPVAALSWWLPALGCLAVHLGCLAVLLDLPREAARGRAGGPAGELRGERS